MEDFLFPDDTALNLSDEFIGDSLINGKVEQAAPFVVNGIVIGRPFNLKQMVRLFGKEIIPDCLGMYHLFYKDQLVYIGMSKSIRGRLLGHLRDKDMPFNNVLWFCASYMGENVTVADVLEIEYKAIKKFKPVLNSVHANCR